MTCPTPILVTNGVLLAIDGETNDDGSEEGIKHERTGPCSNQILNHPVVCRRSVLSLDLSRYQHDVSGITGVNLDVPPFCG